MEDSLKNNPSSQWPEEVKQAYESLKVPSLYDTVLANEKLSLEIRKQNRDVKLMMESTSNIVVQLNKLFEIISEEWEEYEEGEEDADVIEDFAERQANRGVATDLEMELLSDKQVYLEQQAQGVLIDTTDPIIDLMNAVKTISRQLLQLLPKKEGVFAKTPPWHPLAEELIRSLVEEVNRVRYKLLSRLEKMHIHLIDPHRGDLFDQSRHHALEELAGSSIGTIAQVIRPGYIQENKVLRPAEVVVYV